MEQRYDLRKEDDGTWTVFEVSTGLPVVVSDRLMVGLDFGEADDMVELLNLQEVRRRDER